MRLPHSTPLRLEPRLVSALAVSMLVHAAVIAAVIPVGQGTGHSLAARAPEAIRAVVARAVPSVAPQAAPRVERAAPGRKPAAKPRSLVAPDPKPAASVKELPAATSASDDPNDSQRPADAELVVAGTRYFRAAELDLRASPVELEEPEFPLGAAAKEAYLVVRLLVNRFGSVDDFTVLISDPEGEFDAAVARSFSRARFTPAVKDGVPVASEIVLEVKFASALAEIEARIQALSEEQPAPPR